MDRTDESHETNRLPNKKIVKKTLLNLSCNIEGIYGHMNG